MEHPLIRLAILSLLFIAGVFWFFGPESDDYKSPPDLIMGFLPPQEPAKPVKPEIVEEREEQTESSSNKTSP